MTSILDPSAGPVPVGPATLTSGSPAVYRAPVALSPDGPVPFCRTEITVEAQRAAQRVLASGWVTTGPETVLFEQDFATWVGAREAIATSSCTSALELALLGLGLPPGSPVLTPTITFCGAVHAIVHAGLRPVLVDVDEETLTVTPEDVERAARSGAAAMVVQHMAGYPVDGALLAAAAGLPPSRVVDDAAHGLGAACHGDPVGSTSQAACFSFYATKNLPIGEGGAITTPDLELADRLRVLRLHGMSGDAWRRYRPGGSWRYSVDGPGLKANFTDIQAAIGRQQLLALDAWQARRAAVAAAYDEVLSAVPGIQLPPRPSGISGSAGDRHAWHLYIIRVHPAFGMTRDELSHRLASLGIGTSVHFIPIHHHPYFSRMLGSAAAAMPTADRIFPQLLSLPMHPGLSDRDIERVGRAISDLSNAKDE